MTRPGAINTLNDLVELLLNRELARTGAGFAVQVSVFPDNGAQTPFASTFFPVPEAAHPVTLPSVMVKTLIPVPPLHAATAPGLRITPWEDRRLDFGPSPSQMSVPVVTAPSNGPPTMRQLKNPTKIEWPSRSPTGSGWGAPTS